MKDRILKSILEREGGYVNDPSDSGGETNYGITEKVARSYGYIGLMRTLPESLALRIYEDNYWTPVHGDQIVEISPLICAKVVDCAVNMGVKRSGTILQRCLNVLNCQGVLYTDLTVDGVIGNRTVEALAEYIATRDESVLLTAFNCLQGAFYIELAERREKDERFVYGWLKNRI